MITMNRMTLALIATLAISPAAWADRTSAQAAIAEADALITAASRSGAQSVALTSMNAAREQLAAAKASANERDWRDAEEAAIRAQRDAEVAAAMTRANRAESALAELEETVETLRRELQRMGESS